MSLSDTDPEILAAQRAIWQRMSGSEGYALARELSERVRQFTLAGLRNEHPEWSHRELMLELLRQAMIPEPLPVELQWPPTTPLKAS